MHGIANDSPSDLAEEYLSPSSCMRLANSGAGAFPRTLFLLRATLRPTPGEADVFHVLASDPAEEDLLPDPVGEADRP